MSTENDRILLESEETNQLRAIEHSRFHDGSAAIIRIALNSRPATSTRKGPEAQGFKSFFSAYCFVFQAFAKNGLKSIWSLSQYGG